MVPAIFLYVFWQVNLYMESGLQVYYLAMAVYGWYVWREKDRMDERVLLLSRRVRIRWLCTIGALTLVLGTVMGKVDHWFPTLFPEPAAFPFRDHLPPHETGQLLHPKPSPYPK